MRISQCILSVSFSIVAAQAHAGAWTQDPGQGLAILSGSYYAAGSFYTNSGNRQSQSTYSKYELNPYFEYGLADGLTLAGDTSLQRDSTNWPDENSWGIGDTDLYLRKRLWQQNGFVLSAEPMIKLPSPGATSDEPKIGGNDPDVGLGLSGGYGFSAWGLNDFIDLDTQYRYRFGTPKDQYRVNLTAGVGVTQRWTLMPQLFTTWRASNTPNAAFTESSGDDYELIRLQLSALYKLNDTATVQLGGFSDVYGKNTGAGNGGLISFWKKF